MNIKQDSVIVLDNDKKYVVSCEIDYLDNQYILVNGLDDNEEVIIKEILILQVINKNGTNSVIPITDHQKLNMLMLKFKEKLNEIL